MFDPRTVGDATSGGPDPTRERGRRKASADARIERALESWLCQGQVAPFMRDALADDVVGLCANAVVRGPRRVSLLLEELRNEASDATVTRVKGTSHQTLLFAPQKNPERPRADAARVVCSAVTLVHPDGLIQRVWMHAGGQQTRRPTELDWAARWSLTAREAAVARLAAQGLRDKEIAVELNLATASASKYLYRVLRKTGARARWDLPLRMGAVNVG